jgi:Skp family chaperone for outer membrane proteins
MKTVSRVFSVTLLAVVFSILAGPASAMAAKIGVIDMSIIYRDFKEVSKSQAYLKEKKDEYQGKIDKEKFSLKEEELALESLKEDLRKNRDTYSDSELSQKENEQRRLISSWQKKFQSMKGKFQGYKEDLEEIERKEFATIKSRIDKAVEMISKRNRLELVIEKQWVYYGSTIDITAQVVQQLEGK